MQNLRRHRLHGGDGAFVSTVKECVDIRTSAHIRNCKIMCLNCKTFACISSSSALDPAVIAYVVPARTAIFGRETVKPSPHTVISRRLRRFILFSPTESFTKLSVCMKASAEQYVGYTLHVVYKIRSWVHEPAIKLWHEF